MDYTVCSFEALGTHITLEAPVGLMPSMEEVVKIEAERIEQKFSRFRATSELSQLNARLNEWVVLDEEFLKLLKNCSALTQQTAGVFDIGVHQMLEHWGYDADYNLQTDVNPKTFTALNLEIRHHEVRINTPIDLGACGKGYFLDCCAALLSPFNASGYILNAGGDLRCYTKVEAHPWKLFLEDPRCTDRAIGEIEMSQGVLCSSSPSRRAWGNFHHLVDTKLGQPAPNMAAVYVYHPTNGCLADALSTSFFVAGFDRAKELYDELKSTNEALAVMFISAEGDVWLSDNFGGQLYTVS